MIVRLLFFILVFAIGWIIYRQFAKAIMAKSKSVKKMQTKKPHEEAMVKCATCGTFVPASHAVYDHNQTAFCSVEHKIEHQS
ncbi:PP0621 family protein [Marinomonas fungiae]|uniref:PP0621 family protein n=1 Tax=Marinomonas fungiae TaxID=1137284 RepID=UPI003A8D5DE3